MLAGPRADQLAAAIGDLDPGTRALLDLSVRRGVGDEMIAGLLKIEAAQVASRRASVLAALASRLGLAGPGSGEEIAEALGALPPETWHPGGAPAGGRGRRAGAVLLAFGVAAALVTLFVIFGEDDSEPTATRAAPSTTAAKTETAPAGGTGATTTGEEAPVPGVDMERVSAGIRATATARLDGEGDSVRLAIEASRLGPGRYEVWLYDSVAEAIPVRSFRGPSADLDLPLPADPSDYEFVDISREPSDGNGNHSGESVLRVPVAGLLEAG
ncbi:MAG TPA: anti-sigma factor [Thermoleophilaceae bacterium]|nr:anti-sigma factor [Thermoleophilaceae bacterium]